MVQRIQNNAMTVCLNPSEFLQLPYEYISWNEWVSMQTFSTNGICSVYEIQVVNIRVLVNESNPLIFVPSSYGVVKKEEVIVFDRQTYRGFIANYVFRFGCLFGTLPSVFSVQIQFTTCRKCKKVYICLFESFRVCCYRNCNIFSVLLELLYLFYFHSFYDPTQWGYRGRRRNFFDEYPSIDHLYFLH